MRELAETIRATPADMVVIGTPVDLAQLVRLDKPSVRVRYELEELGKPNLASVLEPFLETAGLTAAGLVAVP